MRAGGCAYWTNVQLLHPARELAGLNLAASEPTMVRFLEGHVAAEDLSGAASPVGRIQSLPRRNNNQYQRPRPCQPTAPTVTMAISIKQIVVVIGFFERSGLLCVQETPVGGQNSDTLSGRKVVPQLVIFATRKNAAPTQPRLRHRSPTAWLIQQCWIAGSC